jgi:hypothetical protein
VGWSSRREGTDRGEEREMRGGDPASQETCVVGWRKRNLLLPHHLMCTYKRCGRLYVQPTAAYLALSLENTFGIHAC